MSVFVTDRPELKNQFLDDKFLRDYLEKNLVSEFKDEIFLDLENFGERVVNDILLLGEEAERDEPRLENIGDLNRLLISSAWRKLHDISAKEGLISLGIDKKYGASARLYQFSKKYLFNSSSAYFSCPLAMTDGALKVLIEHGGDQFLSAVEHLSSKNPKMFWTSGQWMTEKNGGSDVSRTETVAKLIDGVWRLYGVKWFTSAVDSEISLALAKPEGEKKLQLFFVKLRDERGNLNNIKILGLKNKLGTKALPTAELELCGVPGIPIGKLGEGVKLISTQFNVTRIHNALECVSSMRRQFALLNDYARKREAFGRKLINLPLFAEVISDLEELFQKCFLFTFKAVELLGVCEQGETFEIREMAEKQLRLLTPLLKLYTAKKNIEFSSEVIECFGGVGYLEDSGIPKFLRDGQVLSIWEGTTNVLSLDFLRAINKEGIEGLKGLINDSDLENIKDKYLSTDSEELQRNARKICLETSEAICEYLYRN